MASSVVVTRISVAALAGSAFQVESAKAARIARIKPSCRWGVKVLRGITFFIYFSSR
jgi:hypothetical protein